MGDRDHRNHVRRRERLGLPAVDPVGEPGADQRGHLRRLGHRGAVQRRNERGQHRVVEVRRQRHQSLPGLDLVLLSERDEHPCARLCHVQLRPRFG
ncbi:hypothetical protein ACZ91_30465 [Streptomyces regensis]|nr:hypothetical protein ACZ91_30465 [Streptomyces regensis]KOG63489.1 hypothetical protein ADK77_23605 [Streptomyces antibioticus]